MAAMASNVCQRKAHFTFTWTIENGLFLFLAKDVLSPMFLVKSIGNTKWRIWVDMMYYTSNRRMFIGIRREKDNGPESIKIKIELSLLDIDGSPSQMKNSERQFKCEDSDSILTEGYMRFIKSEGITLNKDITVRCRMWRTGNEISEIDSCFVRTHLGVDRRSFVWTVKEISRLQLGQKRTHLVNSTSNERPQLSLTVYLTERHGKNYINIKIDKFETIKDNSMYYKISLLNNDGRIVHSVEDYEFSFSSNATVKIFEEFFEKDRLINEESLLQNDTLSLKCEFKIGAALLWCRIENHRYLNLEDLEPIMSEIPERNLDQTYLPLTACCPFKRAFADLYENEILSDVRLRVGSKSLLAHKHILSVRSPVFEAMFTQDMREKTGNIVEISDMNADTLGQLLLYIYKDTMQDLQWESAMDLYRAADKYQLLDLRKRCSLILKSTISMTSVCSILSLADLHNDSDLRKVAENFIFENDIEVFNSDEWKNFKKENLQLVLEIMERMMVNRRNN